LPHKAIESEPPLDATYQENGCHPLRPSRQFLYKLKAGEPAKVRRIPNAGFGSPEDGYP